MLGHCSLGLSSRVNMYININVLSPSTLHTNLMRGSHLVCYFPMNALHQFYDSHGIIYDSIETWLEESYSSNVPINCHCHISNIVNRVFNVLFFPTFSLSLFQVLLLIYCHQHVFACS
jgi:hypothetical protein